MRSLRVPGALLSRVAQILVVEHGGASAVLPQAGAVLGFQYRGSVTLGERHLAPAGVTGMQTAPRTYGYSPGTVSVLVRFTPQGASCLGVPASELAGQSVALEDILPAARVRETRQRFVEAQHVDEAARVLEEFVLGLPHVPDPLVQQALELLEQDGASHVQVARVARELDLSERQLERRFHVHLGLSPKRYAGLRRFERALARLEGAPSLAALALDAGYYDQSHLIREFSRFAGISPGKLVGRTR